MPPDRLQTVVRVGVDAKSFIVAVPPQPVFRSTGEFDHAEGGECSAYVVSDSGAITRVWRKPGLFPGYHVILTSQAHVLVAWSSYIESSRDPMGVAVLFFYRDGELIRSYRLPELSFRPGVLRRSASNFWWLSDEGAAKVSMDGDVLVVRTIDRRELRFSVATGQLVSPKR
jgi:hypothetical protein